MTDTFAKSARPPSTAIAWATRDGLFVEFPVNNSVPYITRFPCTPDGLQRALNVLIENPAPAPRSAVMADHPSLRKAPNATTEQRAIAAGIVAKLFKP